MATTTFDNLITFSRGSNATVVGSNGLIQWAPANLLTNSQDFEAAGWGKVRISVTANSTAAPDGTLTADTLNGSGGGTTSMSQTMPSTGGLHVATIYAKAGTKQFLQFSANAFAWGIDARANFDLQAGTLGTVDAGLAASIQDVGGGWYRCAVAANKAASAGALLWCMVDSASAAREASATAGTLITWGAQLELGSTATTYNNTSVRNLLGFSEAFDNAAWTKSAASIVTGAQANPVNGLFNAQKLMENTAAGEHRAYFTIITSPSTYTYSAYVKAAGRTFASIIHLSVSPQPSVVINLETGAITSPTNVIASGSVNAGNGWWRVWMTYTTTTTTTSYPQVMAFSNATTGSYTGDGNSGVYIYGAMLSNSASLDPYVPTPGAAPSSTAYYGPRFDYDPVTLAARGLLVEEARTNLTLYSEQFDNAAWAKSATTITPNAAISPAGTNNAALAVPSATVANHDITQVVTAAAVSYTLSVYAKAQSYNFLLLLYFDGVSDRSAYFNLSTGTIGSTATLTTPTITAVGNGWYRCAITFTGVVGRNNFVVGPAPSDGGRAVAGNGTSGIYIWGAQLEAGTFATSYIPTIASTVTRSADVATITGSLFSQWYRQEEGAFLVEASSFAEKTGINAYNFTSVNDGTGNNFIRTYVYLNQVGETVRTGAVIQAEISTTPWSQNVPLKLAAVYKTNDFQAALNGTLTAADTAGTLPAVTQMNIGTNNGQGGPANGHIRSIRYVPVRAADFQLQQVTT